MFSLTTQLFPRNLNYVKYRAVISRVMCSVPTFPSLQSQQIQPFDNIPGPKSLPVIGHIHRLFLTSKPLGKQILDLQLQDLETYGPIVKEVMVGRVSIKIAEPMDVAKVLRCEAKYPKRFEIPLFDFYREARKKAPGVFFLNGEEWYKHRSVISKRLLRPKEVTEYAPVFNEIVSDLILRLRNIRGSHGYGKHEVPGLDKELFRWSFESVAYVVLDKRLGAVGGSTVNTEAQQFINAVGCLLEAISPAVFVPVWVYKYVYETKAYKKFVEHFDQMYYYAEFFISEKMKELEAEHSTLEANQTNVMERAEFLRFLLSSKKLTKDDLLASVIDLLFAGVDTTSNTMQWALYMLATNPLKQEKLYQEVTSILGSKEQASPYALTKMPYLKAWVKETLRLYPVIFSLPRMPAEDLVLSGYHVPAGTQINISAYAMGRNETLFEDAGSFKPERWLRDNDENGKEILNPFASLPFGFGQRMCIGRRLAEMELYLLLANIVQKFHITYPESENIQPVLIGTVKPDKPVNVQFHDRK